jgi:hypothetical protein
MKKLIITTIVIVLLSIPFGGGVNIYAGEEASSKEGEGLEQEIESKEQICWWEIKGVRPERRGVKELVNDFLVNNPEWEPFGTTEGQVWVKRRLCVDK